MWTKYLTFASDAALGAWQRPQRAGEGRAKKCRGGDLNSRVTKDTSFRDWRLTGLGYLGEKSCWPSGGSLKVKFPF